MKMKTTVSYGKCEMFIAGINMPCPLCRAMVLSGERHTCRKSLPPEPPKMRRRGRKATN